MKRTSEFNRAPYREIYIKALGDISPLKPSLPVCEEEEQAMREVGDGFSPVINCNTLRKNKLTERRVIFSNISSFLDEFSPHKKSETKF